jgi:ketosteroid isomerase-like protein
MSDGEELVRRIWAQWNSGDREIYPELVDPEVEVHSELAQRIYRGRDEVAEWIREIDEQFSDWELRIDGIEQVDARTVVVTGSIEMRGRRSGLDLHQPASWLVELKDGRLRALRNFPDPRGAAEFLGRPA